MKDKTDELHEEYYRKFGRLRANAALLTDEIKTAIERNLYREYLTEYNLMHASDEIENKRAERAVAIKTSELVPGRVPKYRRFPFFFKKPNRAANEISAEMYLEIEQIFLRQEQRIALLEEQLAELTAEEMQPEATTRAADGEATTEVEEASTPQETADAPAEPVAEPEKPQEQTQGKRKRKKDKQSDANEQVQGQLSLDDVPPAEGSAASA
jgi:hypothetical protein